MSSLDPHVVRHEIGLLNLAIEPGSVSKACTLFDNRRKPNPKNHVDEATEIAVPAYAVAQPAHGQVRVGNEFRRRWFDLAASRVVVLQAEARGAGEAGRCKRHRAERRRGSRAGKKHDYQRYLPMNELQVDLDAWLPYYNGERPRQGKLCGRTALQTLIAGKEVWREKVSQLNPI
ncbi:hypothetical protein [Burkholderia glumae]|uniref:hypothetical protein n=1 Tax=Burkholderia glumae TaxID=337 RepID=UPI003F4955A8